MWHWAGWQFPTWPPMTWGASSLSRFVTFFFLALHYKFNLITNAKVFLDDMYLKMRPINDILKHPFNLSRGSVSLCNFNGNLSPLLPTWKCDIFPINGLRKNLKPQKLTHLEVVCHITVHQGSLPTKMATCGLSLDIIPHQGLRPHIIPHQGPEPHKILQKCLAHWVIVVARVQNIY